MTAAWTATRSRSRRLLVSVSCSSRRQRPRGPEDTVRVTEPHGRDRLSIDVADLRALANYAAALCRRQFLPSLSTDEKKHVDRIRRAVLHREFTYALDLLGEYVGLGDQHILFLGRAFPFLSDEEKVECLRYAWQRLKRCRYQGRALKLFQQAAPGLKSTIPKSWPTEITVYRGSYVIEQQKNSKGVLRLVNTMSHDRLWRRVKRDVRKGFAWTTDRTVALQFAKVDRQGRTGSRIIGCLGSATVSRQDVIAYFGGGPTFDFESDQYLAEFDQEKECIIDPQRVGRVTYEEITTPR